MTHKKHKHFIVAPIACALLLGSMLSTIDGSTLTGRLSAVHHSEDILGVGGDMYMKLSENADLDVSVQPPALLAGSALVQGEGTNAVQIGRSKVQAINGAFYLHRSDNNFVTVAALTTPVLVEYQGRTLIIPIGYQWRSEGRVLADFSDYEQWQATRKLSRVPRAFVRDQLRFAQQFPPLVQTTLPPPRARSLLLRSTTPLRLRSARDRAMRAESEALLSIVHKHVANNKGADVAAALQQDQLQAFAQTDRYQHVLAMLLERSENASTQVSLVEEISRANANHWLLLGLNPAYSTAAWNVPAPYLTQEQRIFSYLLFPQSDYGSQAHTQLAHLRWKNHVKEYKDGLIDPIPFFDRFLPPMFTLHDQLVEDGYPMRALRLRSAVLDIVDADARLLRDEYRAGLKRLETFDDIGTDPIPEALEEELHEAASVSSSSSSSSSVAAATLPADDIVATAYSHFTQVGALFTVETTVEPTTDTTVRIKGLVFSNPREDRFFTLSYDLQRNVVWNIHEAGRTYPYPMSMQQFVQWAKQPQSGTL